MEPKLTNKEVILQAVEELPEEQLAKVVSLVDNLRQEEKQKKAEEYRKAIEETRGKYKDGLSGVDDFMKRKQEEKAFEEAQQERRLEERRMAVKDLKGKYKELLSSSEEFMNRKEEEKKLDR